MNRKIPREHFNLNIGEITHLPDNEIKNILRAADDIIGHGGRSMLAMILKGSRDKKLLKHRLEESPAYGFYEHLSLPQIGNRVDWAIVNNYLMIEYNGRLPLVFYTNKGWEIEKETYTEELLHKLTNLLAGDDYRFVEELKDKDRGMILLLLEKIKNTNNPAFIPLLKAWQEIDYKKVRVGIQEIVSSLKTIE